MITFANGKAFETVAVYGGKEVYQEARRDTLDIVVEADLITLDEAKTIWQDADATSELTITYVENVNGKTVSKTSVYVNYTLPMALALDTLNGVQVVHIKLAQKSALEIMQEQHSADISALDAAILEIGELLGGENNG